MAYKCSKTGRWNLDCHCERHRSQDERSDDLQNDGRPVTLAGMTTTTPKNLNPDLPVGTRVVDQYGNVGTVKRLGFQRAVQGFGIVTPCDVDLDDGRKVSTVTWRLTEVTK